MNLKSIYKLSRLKPTIAWTISGFMLAISIAINEFGYNNINWGLVFISFVPLVIIQSLLSHAVNDLEDEEVDKLIDVKATNRFKVLVSGLMSRSELIVLSLVVLTFSSAVAYYIYTVRGIYIALFYAIGITLTLQYSLPPLKLGWKPFSEFTVVFPLLLTYIVAVNFVATGQITNKSIAYGTIFALFNIIWFVMSRAMDYYPDKESGKITTAVKFGLEWVFNDYKALLLVFTGAIITLCVSLDYRIIASYSYFFIYFTKLPLSYVARLKREIMESILSKARRDGIIISTANSISLSILLLVF